MGNLKNLFYSSLFGGVASGVLSVVLPVYLNESFSTSLTSIGFIFSAYALLFALLQIPFSFLGDRMDKRKLLLFSAVLEGVCNLVYGLASSVSHFILGKGVEGTAAAVSRSPSSALLIELSERHRFSESFGNLIGFFSIGYVLGFLISGPMVESFGFRNTLFALVFFNLIALGFLLLIKHNRQAESIKFNLAKFFQKPHRHLKLFAVTGFLITFVERMDYTVSIIFMKEVYDASITQIGIAMALGWLSFGAIQIYSGRHSDKFGRRKSYLVGGVLAGLCAFLLPNMPSMGAMALLFMLLSAGHGIAYPALRGMLAESTSEKYRSQDFGFVTAFEEAGPLIGFPVMGWIADNLGFNAAFYLRGFVILAVSIIVCLAVKQKVKPKN
jgi:MFS family permease